MPHKYRAAIGRESPRPASRGVIAQFEPRRRNCRRVISLAARWQAEKALFAYFFALEKVGVCRTSGKKMLPTHRQTYLCPQLATKFGRKGDCASRARVPAATSFDQGVRRPGVCPCGPSAQTPFSPAPSEKRRRRFSTAPNRLGGNPFLLIWLECARPVFTLT